MLSHQGDWPFLPTAYMNGAHNLIIRVDFQLKKFTPSPPFFAENHISKENKKLPAIIKE